MDKDMMAALDSIQAETHALCQCACFTEPQACRFSAGFLVEVLDGLFLSHPTTLRSVAPTIVILHMISCLSRQKSRHKSCSDLFLDLPTERRLQNKKHREGCEFFPVLQCCRVVCFWRVSPRSARVHVAISTDPGGLRRRRSRPGQSQLPGVAARGPC